MNTLVDLSAFYPSIKPYAPGVADPTMDFAIRQAAIELCEKTRLWSYEDTFEYDPNDGYIFSPDGSEIHEIELVKFDGVEVSKKTTKWLDDNIPSWRGSETTLTGRPSYVTQTEPDTIVLVPSDSGSVYVSLYLKPSQDCEQVPAFLAGKYRTAIAHGALSHILLIPNQSFSNPELAMTFANSFSGRMDGKQNAGIAGQQRAHTRTKASFM